MIQKRSQEQIQEILNKIGDTVILKNFIDSDTLQYLLDIYDSNSDKQFKKTGPTTLEYHNLKNDTVYQKLFSDIQDAIGIRLSQFAGNIFRTNVPYVIHNDVPRDHNIMPAKCIVVPMKKHYSENQVPKDSDAKFYIFDQMYFHGPVKCFKNNPEEIYSPHNIPLYDYSDIYNLREDNSKPDIQDWHLTKDNRQWLEGLSIHKECEWIPGDVIIFDCVRLHAASNFLTSGITHKTGLSIFTTYTHK